MVFTLSALISFKMSCTSSKSVIFAIVGSLETKKKGGSKKPASLNQLCPSQSANNFLIRDDDFITSHSTSQRNCTASNYWSSPSSCGNCRATNSDCGNTCWLHDINDGRACWNYETVINQCGRVVLPNEAIENTRAFVWT